VKSFLFLLWLPGILISSLHAGPGEKGRPKVLPSFKIHEGYLNDPGDALGITDRQPGDLSNHGNITLHRLDGTSIKLEELWQKKPVLIVHSSLTCPISRDNCPHVERIRDTFGDQLEVVVLFTTEAHPAGRPSPYSEGGKLEWITDRNLKFLH